MSVGPNWQANAYLFSSLVAANPGAVLVDAWPNDGGMPSGAVMPSILLVSGDSSNIVRSGKRITTLLVNGTAIFP